MPILNCESMSDAELIQDMEQARNNLPKRNLKGVEECLSAYKDILVAAYRRSSDSASCPSGLVSDLEYRGYMRNGMFLTQKGKDFVEKEVLIIK